jgi:hypothetical protein
MQGVLQQFNRKFMKQTAVEWLIDEYFGGIDNCTPDFRFHIQQAKEMEKEQMKDSYKKGFAYRDTWNWELNVDWDEDSTKENENEFEQYYNETFKSE